MHKKLLVTAMVLVMVGGACAGDETDDAGGAGPSTTQVEQPVRGGTLVVGIEGENPPLLNPAATSNGGVHTASEPMFNGLVGFDADRNPTPELAERWEVLENGAVYRFTLRDGVRFHDGTVLTSDDVKWTFEAVLLKLHARTRASLSAASLTIEVPDARTVVFRFAKPYAPLLQQLNVTEAPILPRKVYEPCGDTIDKPDQCRASGAPVGTGPFKFVSRDASEIRLARSDTYFRTGQPYLDGLTMRFFATGQGGSAVLALQAGEIDWLWTVPGPDLAVLRTDSRVALAEAGRGPGGGNCVLTVVFNLRPGTGVLPFFGDLRTRQAFAAAINRQQAADQILFGQGKVASQPIHTAVPVAQTTGLTLPAFDQARARQLLDEVGWKVEGGSTRVARGVAGVPDGTPFKVDYHAFTGIQTDYGQALRQQLAAVGIELEVQTQPNADLTGDVFTRRDFETAVVSYCNESDPQIGVRRQYHSSQISTAAFTNGSGYSDPQMDALWDQAGSEVDLARRRQLFQQIQQQAVRDLPYWWLAETVNTRAFSSSCTGFNIQNTGLFAEGAYCRA